MLVITSQAVMPGKKRVLLVSQTVTSYMFSNSPAKCELLRTEFLNLNHCYCCCSKKPKQKSEFVVGIWLTRSLIVEASSIVC